MNCDEFQEWAASEALGALGPDEAARLRERLTHDASARAELTRFLEAAGSLATTLPRVRPSPAVRERVLARIRSVPRPSGEAGRVPAGNGSGPTAGAAGLPEVRAGFHFVLAEAPWQPSPLPGARMKVLSAGAGQDYAMLLVEIGAGVIYPEHDHFGAEEMFVLTGDLQTEGRSLGPGDFLHAESGTHHRPLRSVGGCTAIMVVAREALDQAMKV